MRLVILLRGQSKRHSKADGSPLRKNIYHIVGYEFNRTEHFHEQPQIAFSLRAINIGPG